jgi:hypothetical protein
MRRAVKLTAHILVAALLAAACPVSEASAASKYQLSMACAAGNLPGMAPGTPSPTLYCTMGASATTSAVWANYFTFTAKGIPTGGPTITYT